MLAVVANDTDVYIAGIAGQHIVDRNKFVGTYFPSEVSEAKAPLRTSPGKKRHTVLPTVARVTRQAWSVPRQKSPGNLAGTPSTRPLR